MAKTVKRGMFLDVYADLIDLSPKNLARPSSLRNLMVETFVYEIIDLSFLQSLSKKEMSDKS